MLIVCIIRPIFKVKLQEDKYIQVLLCNTAPVQKKSDLSPVLQSPSTSLYISLCNIFAAEDGLSVLCSQSKFSVGEK